MYKVKRPVKQNHHFQLTTKTFESCFDKSKIKIQRQSEPNDISRHLYRGKKSKNRKQIHLANYEKRTA